MLLYCLVTRRNGSTPYGREPIWSEESNKGGTISTEVKTPLRLATFSLLILTLASCGGGIDDQSIQDALDQEQNAQGSGDSGESQSSDDTQANLPEAELILRGTEKRPSPDGYVEVPGACMESTQNVPTLGPMSTYVPDSWGPAGAALGQSNDSGSVSFFVENANLTIEVRMLYPDWQNDDQPRPDSVLNALGEVETVGSVTWDGEEVEVLHNGTTYAALLPIMTITGEPLGAGKGPHLMYVRIQEPFEDDAATQDTIFTVIESFSSHECVADIYSNVPNLKVSVES